MNQECIFCRKFGTPMTSCVESPKQECDTILIETQQFIVAPALGPLAEGHVLIITKAHVYSMGELSEYAFNEFISLKSKVQRVLVQTYGSATLFEHGSTPVVEAGASVNHAHCHAMPLNFDLAYEVSKHFNGENISDLSVLRSKAAISKPYLFVENNQQELEVFDAPINLPSQYLRRLIATKLGAPTEWNWRTHPAFERVTSTVAKLRGSGL